MTRAFVFNILENVTSLHGFFLCLREEDVLNVQRFYVKEWMATIMCVQVMCVLIIKIAQS